MEDLIFKELQELKKLTLLGVKKALSMGDCAILTGLSKSHIYKLVMNKKIPYWKSEGGKITYFDKQEIEAWLLRHRVKTTAEIETEVANYIILGKRGGKK